MGAMAELVDDGRTGRLFNPGDADDLAAKVVELTSDAGRLEAMGRAARAEYETKYTAEANYDLLCDIYERAAGRQLVERESGANVMQLQ
jgi:glycosyltransferase involved in cell wall biosynthesis